MSINETRRENSTYTEKELENKYRFQKKWQDKNNFKTKSYRLNSETIDKLHEFAKNNNMSHTGILLAALEHYKTNKKSFDEKYKNIIVSKKIDTKKGFKMYETVANEIADICNENNYLYGVFVTTILESFFEYMSK